MSDDLVKRFRALQVALDHGCSDGGCVIEVTKGQYTNGGCKCLYQPSHATMSRVGHMLRCAQDMADRIEELEADLQDAHRVGAEWFEQSKQNHKRSTTAEAKLAKAVAALYAISGDVPYADDPYDIARITLAELKGEK
jgi:hypothetical protein